MIFLVFFYNVPVGEFEKKNVRNASNYKNEIRRTNGQKKEGEMGKRGGTELLKEIFRIRHTFWLK